TSTSVNQKLEWVFGLLFFFLALNSHLTNAFAQPDPFEVDDKAEQASFIFVGAQPQNTHNFHVGGDTDWFRFFGPEVSLGYTISVAPIGANPGLNPIWTLYDSDGQTILLTSSQGTQFFPPRREDIYFIEVSNQDPNVFGEDTTYSIAIAGDSGPIIYGIVRDKATDKPLPGVTITIPIAIVGSGTIDASTQSKGPPNAGYYAISYGITTFTLTAALDGYVTSTQQVSIDDVGDLNAQRDVSLQPIDISEPNDTPETADLIFVESSDFAEPVPPEEFRFFDSVTDVDWVRFFGPQDPANPGRSYTILVEPQGDNASTVPNWTLYDSDGKTPLLTSSQGNQFVPPRPEDFYFIELTNSNPGLIGNETTYSVRVGGLTIPRIGGVVQDACTEQPLPGVNVSIQGVPGASDTSREPPNTGIYIIDFVAGSFTLLAEIDGYDTNSREFFISPGVNKVEHNISMQPEQSDQIAALIRKYYNDILDREPDNAGFLVWQADIQRIVSLGIDIKEGFIALARFFFNSDEYFLQNKTNLLYVTDLYQTFFSREPDIPGLTFWVDLLDQGLGRNVVLNSFVFSTEFDLFMDNLFCGAAERPIENLVNDLYRGLLSRLPDNAGFDFWADEMQNAQNTGSQAVRDLALQITLGFLQSDEYGLRGRNDVEFLEDLYNGILRRGAQKSEFDGWISLMNAGMSREEVLRSFTDSPEFQLRVQAIIDAAAGS
ncbi:MAG: DUF4214 domain-containing protein, partial [Desulfobacterales bacterium]